MKFRRRSVLDNSINITPLIDVVFLLLIFFMVSTTFTKETHLVIDLPEASGVPAESLPDNIEILVASDGSYSVNGVALVNRQPETLISALRQLGDVDKTNPLVIAADATSSHQAVVTAMDAAGQAGFVHLSITTQLPEPTN